MTARAGAAPPQMAWEVSGPSRFRFVVWVNLWVQQLALMIPVSALGIMLPLLTKDFDVTLTNAGWLGAVRFIGPTLLTIPASAYLSRAVGSRSYALLLAGAGLSGFAIGLAPTFGIVLAMLALHSTLGAFTQIPVAALRLRWTAREEFGLMMGLTMAVGAIGSSLATVVIPFVVPRVGGWRAVFFTLGAVLIVIAALWPLVTWLGRRSRMPRPMSAVAAPRFRMGEALRHGQRQPVFVLAGLTMLFNAGAWMGFILFMPKYLTDVRGFDLQTAGIVASMAPLAGAAGSLGSGWLSDRVGLRRPLMRACALAEVPLYLLVLSPLPVMPLIAAFFVLGFVAWGPVTLVQTMAHEIPGASVDDVVVGQGVMRTVNNAGSMLTPLMISYIATTMGSLGLGLGLIGMLPLGVVALSFLLPETGWRATRVEPAPA